MFLQRYPLFIIYQIDYYYICIDKINNMTLQQLEYVAALDKYRHFVKAAESCNITQSTLSSMIQKLEDELDVVIFDRSTHPVRPTSIGEKVISQAKVILFHSSNLKEMILSERRQEEGELKLGIIPTVAPYLIPRLFGILKERFPGVKPRVTEARTAVLIQKLNRAEIDVAIMATPIESEGLLEIPLYYEKFLAYIAPEVSEPGKGEISLEDLPPEQLWLLKEGHCLRNQVMNICNRNPAAQPIYEAGSIDTLVKIVDLNGGYTIIPELHEKMLSDEQKSKVRRLQSPEPVREVSMVIRNDYVRERMLNIISECVQSIIPEPMIDKGLRKFAIKL